MLVAKRPATGPERKATVLRAVEVERLSLRALERDELWSLVGSKLNPRWVWIALCRQTRQVVACLVGDRSAGSARALRERIPVD